MKRILSMLMVLALLACMLPVSVLAADAQTTPMYRLYNPNSGEHFYTGSLEEKENLVAAGWNYEGIAWNAPTKSGDPVYRLYNPNSGDHHYTMSAVERDMLVGYGWQYEGVCWNSVSSLDADAVPLFRLYNPNADCGSHHYTTSTEERDNLVTVGWILEGIGWFGAGNHVHSFQGGACTGCGAAEPAATLKINTPNKTVVWVGEPFQIDFTYTGKGTLTWTSESDSYISVDGNGKVTPNRKGGCTITVSDGNLSASVLLNTKEKAITAESIKVTGTNAPLWDGVNKFAGDYMNIHVVVKPNDISREITVSSSNPSVVSVSSRSINSAEQQVRLDFGSPGSATITITSEDGCASQSWNINVKSDYNCDPGPGLLSPEQWADTCTQVMVENGFTKNTSCGSYRVLTLSDSELTWRNAKACGEGYVHSWWGNGCTHCWISYEGVDAYGNHVFYTRWG